MLELKKRIKLSVNQKSGKGFTIIEIIVVLGIMTVVFGMGSILFFDSIQRSVSKNEATLVATLLTGQRTKALSNVNQHSFGLKVEPSAYTTFEGSSFLAGTNMLSVAKGSAITTSGDTEVVFNQLTGNNSAGLLTINITDGAKTVPIAINSEGRVDW
jgi:prepilin-type N-terminal cleavage/methylation domain-containing protein